MSLSLLALGLLAVPLLVGAVQQNATRAANAEASQKIRMMEMERERMMVDEPSPTPVKLNIKGY